MRFDWLMHDSLTRFIAQVVAIVVVARLFGLVARRFGQPIVLAEIVAGIVLGPSLLGWIAPDASAALFAPGSLELLELVSELGLILFMFLIGLELDPKLLRARAGSSLIISNSGIIVPFALGALLALYLHPRVSDPGVSLTSFTLFVGASMSITAFPVLARILSERRLLRSRVGVLTIACAAVDDVSAWCLLAFVVAAARAKGMVAAAVTTGLALAYVAVMFWLVRPLLGRVAARVANRAGLTHNLVAVVLLLLFASSWATELIGIHALFGAFLFGVILPREGGLVQALAEKLEDLVLVLLLPLFFAYSGLRTRIGLLDTRDAWIACALIIAVACLGKFGGCAVAARLTGLSWRESGALGILMNTRGLMALIVLNIGLDLGVISPTLFTMMVVMALVTTLMTGPVLDVVYPQEQLERDVLATGKHAPAVEPEPEPASFTIVVCVAYDRSGPGLVSLAGALLGAQRGGQIHALHLLGGMDRVSFRLQEGAAGGAEDGLEPLLTRARELDLAVKPISFVSPEPAEDICSVARAKDADLVLIGWHKPMFGRGLLGGTVYQVMKEAGSDVAVFVDRGLSEVRRILLPFVGTPHDHAALKIARRLLRAGVELTLLHVKSPTEKRRYDPSSDEGMKETLEEPEGGRVLVRVVYDDAPVDVALGESRKEYDLVVVGVGGDRGLEQRLLGTHPERLIRESTASLLLIRGHSLPTEERARRQMARAVAT